MKQKLARSLFIVLSVIIMFSMTVGMSASAAATTKALATNFTLVNLGASSASVTVDYIKPDGTPWTGSAYTSNTLAANGGQWIVRQYQDTNLQSGKGSVVISSSQPLGALVQVVTTSGTPTNGAYSGFTGGSSKAFVPQVAKNATTATGVARSQIMIQNTGTAAATITLKLLPYTGGTAVTRTFSNVAAGATYYYDMTDDAALATGFYSASIDAGTGTVAVVINNFFGNDGLQTSNGFPSTAVAAKWFIPLLYSRLTNTLNTSLIIQNLDTAVVPINDITLSCTKDPAAPGPGTLSIKYAKSVAVNGVATYNTLTDTTNFPTGWYGGCNVASASGKKLVVTVVYRYKNTAEQAAYEAIPATSTDKTVFVPLVAKRLTNKFATAITIQNLSTTTATVTITYTPTTGTAVTRTGVTIPAGGSIIRNFRLAGTESPEIADGWVGSMKVTSNVPIQAYIANTYLTVLGDRFMAYRGFTIP